MRVGWKPTTATFMSTSAAVVGAVSENRFRNETEQPEHPLPRSQITFGPMPGGRALARSSLVLACLSPLPPMLQLARTTDDAPQYWRNNRREIFIFDSPAPRWRTGPFNDSSTNESDPS